MIYEIEKALEDCGLNKEQQAKVAALLQADDAMERLTERTFEAKKRHEQEWALRLAQHEAEREAIQAKCPHSWQWHGGCDESYYKCRACGLEAKQVPERE